MPRLSEKSTTGEFIAGLLFHFCRIAAIRASVHVLFASPPWVHKRNIASKFVRNPKLSTARLTGGQAAARPAAGSQRSALASAVERQQIGIADTT
jgi:hypothetical protein